MQTPQFSIQEKVMTLKMLYIRVVPTYNHYCNTAVIQDINERGSQEHYIKGDIKGVIKG